MLNQKPLEILVAPNSFKGSLNSMKAAQIIEQALEESQLSCNIKVFPIADGGSDTMLLLSQKTGAKMVEAYADDALGNQILCSYGWVESNKTAIIGLSEASGLQLMDSDHLHPLIANTAGTGQQIIHALQRGAKTVLLALGGSATTDGGAGILKALGLQLCNKWGKELQQLPKDLLKLNSVEMSKLQGIREGCEFILLCDVQNRLLGENGSARVFARQKGANEWEVEYLEDCIRNWNRVTLDSTGIDMSQIVSGGAAGGVAAGLTAYLNARCISGIDYVLDTFGFDDMLKDADIVITAEGKIDSQTLQGKGPFGVAVRAMQHHIPVVAFAGEVETNEKLNRYFHEIIAINQSKDLKEELKNTAGNLQKAVMEFTKRLLNVGC